MCRWIKPRKKAVGSTQMPPFKSGLGFLLFCCYRHFNRLLDAVFPIESSLCAFAIFLDSLKKKKSSLMISTPQNKIGGEE